MGMMKYSQSILNFETISKKKDRFHCLHADKHQSLYKLTLLFLMEEIEIEIERECMSIKFKQCLTLGHVQTV